MTYSVGDDVLLPSGEVATVVYLCPDGRVAVETPWSAEWFRFERRSLRPVVDV